MNVIYADSLFALSVFTDYLLCLVTARFCALRLRRGRYLLAAILGGVYAVAVFLPGCAWMAHPLCELCAAGLMGLVAFGGEEKLFRCLAAFLAVSASFGGAAWAVALRRGSRPAPDLRLLIGVFLGSYALLTLLSHTRHRRAREHRTAVTLTLDGRQADFAALEDSGNCLRDSLTGRAVLLASPKALRPLFPGKASLLEVSDAVELVTRAGEDEALRGRFRLLSCGSVGGPALLAAFRPDDAAVDGKKRDDLLVAVTRAAAGDGFEGIV
ncbi:MAG: sigma-E processing peptidase SpoIIGA [Oscillospiraceae bacterium]|nr:sigma-E processing peptidase SpoIIGA [Oscillospiraceae bacterium]